MIYNVPDPPVGSKIAVEPDAYELGLSWGGRRSMGRLVLSVVGSVVIALVGTAMEFIDLTRPGIWALRSAVGFAFVAFVATVVEDYRALRPETLLLRLDKLTHTAGGKNSNAAPVREAPWRFRWWSLPVRRDAPRTEVGEFGAGVRNGKRFVTAKVTHDDVLEIGWGLGDADREWLVEVLRRWKESAA